MYTAVTGLWQAQAHTNRLVFVYTSQPLTRLSVPVYTVSARRGIDTAYHTTSAAIRLDATALQSLPLPQHCSHSPCCTPSAYSLSAMHPLSLLPVCYAPPQPTPSDRTAPYRYALRVSSHASASCLSARVAALTTGTHSHHWQQHSMRHSIQPHTATQHSMQQGDVSLECCVVGG